MWILAQAEPLVPGGIAGLGVIAVALLVGISMTYRWGVLPERTRADRLEVENAKLNAVTIERVVPALVSATELLAEINRERKRRGEPF